ncbi:nuclear transport factor 2 family protein [Paracidobacterium acidisoli]|uniref:Nuclear transport factor 2 family protein n=1 Tax=Paracidobacterium acidisoli TaxID=2303751 RepID=A0A372IM52_9BACT|nr:nuclear transport factor 2 family protein [Paracidobacterium acidisoli]MBT9331630.1 nuclear transport factor 2 family protein [Paracidobacterium acidisoli]
MRLIRRPHFLTPAWALAVIFFTLSLPALAQRIQAADAGSAQPPEIKEFQQLEDQWSNAVVKNDQFTMDLLLSPLYVGISSGGDVTTRNQQISLLFDKATEPQSMEQKVASVREFGDTAIVSGTYIEKRRANGSVREERGIFTHVYTRSHNRWSCVNSQRTAVVQQADTKPKVERKSNAELPFHIPLFHKGAESTQPAPDPGSNPAPQN